MNNEEEEEEKEEEEEESNDQTFLPQHFCSVTIVFNNYSAQAENSLVR